MGHILSDICKLCIQFSLGYAVKDNCVYMIFGHFGEYTLGAVIGYDKAHGAVILYHIIERSLCTLYIQVITVKLEIAMS